MRIIAGRARGLRLRVPPRNVRPTADRVREALFNVLAHRLNQPCEGARVLDLFAGAGGLGLEALSRGAASLVLVEIDRRVSAVLASNLAAVRAAGVRGDAQIQTAPVEAFLTRPGERADLVFLDPPYQAGRVAPTVEALFEGSWLAERALVVVEHHPLEVPPGIESDGGLDVAFSRRYGDETTLTVLERAL